MITAPLLSLFIIPAAYKLMWLSGIGASVANSPPRLRRSGKLAMVAPFFWPA